MKKAKRTLSLALALVLLVSVMAMPALALEDPWPSRFASFTPISTTNRNYNYTMALQAYLCSISDYTFGLILSSGGMDGSYGPKTAEAVRWVQEALFFPNDSSEWDGKCGPKTWRCIGESLNIQGTEVENGSTYTKFYLWDNNIYRVRAYGSQYEYSYWKVLTYDGWGVFRIA